MNKKEIMQRKKRLFVIGSARGVNRFFITNELIKKFNNAKIINTGAFIFDLTKKLNLKSFDFLTFKEYFQIIEPILVQSIQNHLEHEDVILDTHFHYLMPALALESLLNLKNYIKEVILILVEEDVLSIFKRNETSSDWWFKNIQNIDIDLKSNKYYLNFYEQVFRSFVKTKKMIINLSNTDIKDVHLFLKEIE